MNDSLLIRIYSFSFKNGHFGDPSGNGGGFVLDCRSLPNPGRNPDFADLTGIDEEVTDMLDESADAQDFIGQAVSILKEAADNYQSRNFSDLMASFGCTGGRHRSVYCAERAAAELKNAGYEVRLIHWEMERYDPRFCLRRAMILAAGVGARLKPLTDNRPKALVEAGGIPMLDWTVASLTEAGISEIVVNAHHFRDDLAEYIQSKYPASEKLTIRVSEESELLGTGGGLRKAARYLHGPLPVMVHNTDIWTDFDLAEIYQKHNPQDGATLVCQERESSRYLLADEEMKVCGRYKDGEEILAVRPAGKLSRLAFSGIHVISPAVLELLSETVYPDIIDCYLLLIHHGATIRAVETAGNWFDMGTVEKLAKLERFLESIQH